jgi:hypothetical protein
MSSWKKGEGDRMVFCYWDEYDSLKKEKHGNSNLQKKQERKEDVYEGISKSGKSGQDKQSSSKKTPNT